MNNKKLSKEKKGFTLIEVMVSVSLFVILILLVNSLYIVSQRAYTKGSNKGELVQNARVCIDRLSREIRQSVEIITSLPATSTGALSSEIFFRDGHNIDDITYIYYYLDNDQLIRQHRAYFFSAEPETYVTLSSVDGSGDPPEVKILEDRVVGEYFDSVGFWGDDGLVHVEMDLNKNNDDIRVTSSVYSRNR